jgi:outer membrane protein assembly complex protein YaeT
VLRPSCRAIAATALVIVVAAGTSACHEEGDVQVASLTFEGNRVFSDGRLKAVVATRVSGRLPWSRKRYFTRSVFDADLERVKAFYLDRGYPSLRVTSVGVDFNEKKDAVHLRVVLDEGAPVIVERIAFSGLESAPPTVTDRLDSLPLKAGVPRDRQLVAASRERLTFLLKDRGFAKAAVTSRESAGSEPDRVIVTFDATPGPESRFGEIGVEGLRDIHQSLVLRTLSFRPGDQYRESRITQSQTRLSSLGIFDFAHVGPVTQEPAPPADVVPMRVTVTEGRPQRYQIGVGYGTEDGPRGSFQWEHLNFAGDARRLSLDSRYSFRLQGMGLEFTEPYFLTTRLSFNARLGAWWSKEATYDSRSIGGRFGLTFRRIQRSPNLRRIEHTLRATYVNEALDYAITPEALADQTQFDELIALGLDPTTGQGSGRRAAIEFDVERSATDRLGDPHRGHSESLHLVYATPGLGGTFRYNEVLGEGRVYVPLGSRHVWATRVRLGAIYSESADDLPFSQRYFLGGSSSLRGWGRFQVAPLTDDGLPIGGRALFEFSTELRLMVRGSFGAVLFVDAGNVWDESTAVRLRDLLVAIGPGLRWVSPIGIVRGDIGFQRRRLPGLAIDGEPEQRFWRVHFSIGHAF